MHKLAPVLLMVLLAGCASGKRSAPDTAVATQVAGSSMMGMGGSSEDADYRIGAIDLLKISVFQVPDLSFDELRVDAAGNIQLPLIGNMVAAGRTPAELSRDIEDRLGERYLRNPQVNVTVAEAASQKVTVDGAVTKPGVYTMRGRTSLIQAVAMAEGATRTADLDSVAVFRVVDGRRMVAVFDLGAIRGGQAPDPVIRGDDVIVVDSSSLSVALREVVAALPALAAFAYY